MINPFTAQARISSIQQEVLGPLYTMHDQQQEAGHNYLLAQTGRAIARHQGYIEELCTSWLVAAVFKIVKLLGGAERLTSEDFERFTNYVRDGGIKAMIAMLLAADKEKAFTSELGRLPGHIQENAPRMLAKSRDLHADFIAGFFRQQYGSHHQAPSKLQDNFDKSDRFIARLVDLAEKNLQA